MYRQGKQGDKELISNLHDLTLQVKPDDCGRYITCDKPDALSFEVTGIPEDLKVSDVLQKINSKPRYGIISSVDYWQL